MSAGRHVRVAWGCSAAVVLDCMRMNAPPEGRNAVTMLRAHAVAEVGVWLWNMSQQGFDD